MRLLKAIVLSGLSLCPALSLASAKDSSSLFDKPIREVRTPLPRDPDNPQSKPMLSCFYYSHFMIKQIDLGEIGAQQISILYIQKGHEQPPCRRPNAKDEKVLDPKAWDGYFKGVKGDVIFLDAADGVNGGQGFAVINVSDGAKVFDDVAKSEMSAIELISPTAQSDPNINPNTAIKLSYTRVYQAPCSLRADEKNCWLTIKQITGLTEQAPPDCAAWYEAEEKRLPDRKRESASDPSVITYDVEVLLDSRNTIVRVTPISKAVECYGAD
jgi:hypothetical protein